jgi:hypothetical protein
MSLSVELALGHYGARARCLTSSWSEKSELRRVINEQAIQLRDLCAVSGAKRRSCTNTERTIAHFWSILASQTLAPPAVCA